MKIKIHLYSGKSLQNLSRNFISKFRKKIDSLKFFRKKLLNLTSETRRNKLFKILTIQGLDQCKNRTGLQPDLEFVILKSSEILEALFFLPKKLRSFNKIFLRKN